MREVIAGRNCDFLELCVTLRNVYNTRVYFNSEKRSLKRSQLSQINHELLYNSSLVEIININRPPSAL